MKKGIFRKGRVLGIIFLFVGAGVLSSVGSRTNSIVTNMGKTVFSDWPYDCDIIVPDDYETIQEATDAVSPDGCICVRNGT